jgi:energy-coupling factor transport system ATP-binding protein
MEEVTSADQVFVMDHGKIVMSGSPRQIFSKVEELQSYRMDVPQATLLAWKLKQRGLNLPDGILSVEELVDALNQL